MNLIQNLTEKYMKPELPAMNVGDTVRVKFLGTDEKGRMNLSMRDAAPKAE